MSASEVGRCLWLWVKREYLPIYVKLYICRETSPGGVVGLSVDGGSFDSAFLWCFNFLKNRRVSYLQTKWCLLFDCFYPISLKTKQKNNLNALSGPLQQVFSLVICSVYRREDGLETSLYMLTSVSHAPSQRNSKPPSFPRKLPCPGSGNPGNLTLGLSFCFLLG